ncbi:UNVERIFIED_CONTAM: hypothetical protein FKN15_061118 [Acipenser sinensis]
MESDLSSIESEDIQPGKLSPVINIAPRLVSYPLPSPPSHGSTSSRPRQKSLRQAPVPAQKQLLFKDWLVARMLKAIFDSGTQIPPSADRNTLFLLLCNIQDAEPIFPPAKHRRAAPRGQLASCSAVATPTPGTAVDLTSAAPSSRASHRRISRHQQSNASDSDFNLQTHGCTHLRIHHAFYSSLPKNSQHC